MVKTLNSKLSQSPSARTGLNTCETGRKAGIHFMVSIPVSKDRSKYELAEAYKERMQIGVSIPVSKDRSRYIKSLSL